MYGSECSTVIEPNTEVIILVTVHRCSIHLNHIVTIGLCLLEPSAWAWVCNRRVFMLRGHQLVDVKEDSVLPLHVMKSMLLIKCTVWLRRVWLLLLSQLLVKFVGLLGGKRWQYFEPSKSNKWTSTRRSKWKEPARSHTSNFYKGVLSTCLRVRLKDCRSCCTIIVQLLPTRFFPFLMKTWASHIP